jgi:hypothetical protein
MMSDPPNGRQIRVKFFWVLQSMGTYHESRVDRTHDVQKKRISKCYCCS